MATVTAAPPEAPARRIWQIPMLVVGVAAFVATWQGWLPVGPRDATVAFAADLAALRAAGDKTTPDPGELRALLRQITATAEAFPEYGPVVHFALGTGHVRLAECTPDAAEAQNSWVLARQHLDQVKPDQLPDPADPPRLAYRATKARAATLGPAATAAEIHLLRSVLATAPLGEPPGEAQRLSAELGLRLNPPDAAGAKASLTRYIAEAGLATPPGSIARAKLRLSEVHLLLNEPDQARKWLEQIKDAPPDVMVPAKAQLARVLMTEGDWDGAARQWESVRATAGLPPHLRSMSAYYLGVCRQTTRDTAAAAKLFEEAAKSEGPEGNAAAVRLADLRFRSDDPARRKDGVGLLLGVVKGVTIPGGFANPLTSVAEVQAAFELGMDVLLKDNDHEAAAKLADAYTAVALPGRDREKRAEVQAAWGAALQKSGGEFKPKLTAAADEYVALVSDQPRPDGKAELLRRAATLYRQAGNPQAAVTALEAVVALPELPDAVAGPAWVEFAQALAAANPGNAKATTDALNHAMASKSVGLATRYKIARTLLDTRDPQWAPLGLVLLEQAAGQTTVSPAEAETHERALVELAHEYIRQGNFKEAEARLSVQLSRYPNGPEAGLGKLLKGVCLLQLAAAKAKPTDPEPATAPKMRTDALKLFQEIVDDVDKREKAGSASERDRWLRLQASLRICQTYLQTGQPDEVVKAAAVVIERHRGSVEELIVLSLIYHAQKQGNRPDLAARTRERMWDVFTQLRDKPGAFKATSGEYSREYWEKTWFTDMK